MVDLVAFEHKRVYDVVSDQLKIGMPTASGVRGNCVSRNTDGADTDTQ
jgi:hypothetical protein